MRIKEVELNGKKFTVKESRIKELREEILPKVFDDLSKIDSNMDMNNIVTLLIDKIVYICPGVTQDDVDNAYPSEVEGLIQAWVDVNFTGIKTAGSFTLSLLKNNIVK